MRPPLVLAALALVLIALGAFTATTASAENQTVDTGNMYFCSSAFQGAVCETQVNTGDTVTWSVSSGFHTVTQCDAAFTTCPPSGGFSSGGEPLSSGDTFSTTFTAAGTYYYYCDIHPTDMRGSVVVAQPSTPAPTATPAPTEPGATAGPTTAAPAATTAPQSVPRTGGPPATDDSSLWLLLIGAGITLLTASTGLALATVRKQ